MNTSKLLATSAVVMLMAATVPSMAQQHEGTPQRQAPAEKMAPQQNAPKGQTQAPSGRSETTGQAPREERQGKPSEQKSEQKSQQEHGKTEQQNRGRGETTGQAPREERQGKPSEQKSQQEHGKTEQPRTDQDRVQRNERTNSPSQERERSRSEGGRETTGQGAAGAKTLTAETRTRIHEIVVRERNAPRVSPDFEVSVGARVPNTVRFLAVPQTVVEIEPEWRGFSFFMVGERMVIFNPRTMEIVAIIDA